MNSELSESDIEFINKMLDENTINVNNVDNVKPYNNDETLILKRDKALSLARALDDVKNLNFYIRLVKNAEESSLFESLSVTLEARKQGKIRFTNAKYFVGVLKRKGIRW